MPSNIQGLMRTHHCGELRTSDIGKNVIICGWVNKYRNLGSLHFIDVRDKFGVTQLGFVNFKGNIDELKKCSLESVILAKGVVQSRPSEAKNSEMATGEIEVQVEELTLYQSLILILFHFYPTVLLELVMIFA
jgi:aspartyl-tRNA synthetase